MKEIINEEFEFEFDEKEWKVIEEAPDYEVSNYGDVRNIQRNTLLKGSLDKNGYPRVMIVNSEGKKVTRFRHRLAALAFLPNPNNYPIINHKDEDKGNPFVGTKENNYEDGNLEWCTMSYNVNYGEGAIKRAEHIRAAIGGGQAVYVYDAKTKELIDIYSSSAVAAKRLDADYRTIYRILYSGKSNKLTHHGMHFSFTPLEFDNN